MKFHSTRQGLLLMISQPFLYRSWYMCLLYRVLNVLSVSPMYVSSLLLSCRVTVAWKKGLMSGIYCLLGMFLLHNG